MSSNGFQSHARGHAQQHHHCASRSIVQPMPYTSVLRLVVRVLVSVNNLSLLLSENTTWRTDSFLKSSHVSPKPSKHESKTGSKTALLLSTPLDKHRQKSHKRRSTGPQTNLRAGRKRHPPKFKSSHLFTHNDQKELHIAQYAHNSLPFEVQTKHQ